MHGSYYWAHLIPISHRTGIIPEAVQKGHFCQEIFDKLANINPGLDCNIFFFSSSFFFFSSPTHPPLPPHLLCFWFYFVFEFHYGFMVVDCCCLIQCVQ